MIFCEHIILIYFFLIYDMSLLLLFHLNEEKNIFTFIYRQIFPCH